MEEHFDILFIEDNPHKAEPAISSLKKLRLVNRIHNIDAGAETLNFIFGGPSCSGDENAIVLRQIKSDECTKVQTTVVLTSSKEEKDESESYKLEVNSYLVDPVNFKSFGKTLTERGLYRVILIETPIPNNKL